MTISSTSASSPRRTPSPDLSASPARPAAREPGAALGRPLDAPASSRPTAAQGSMAPRGAVPARPASQHVATLSSPIAASRSPSQASRSPGAPIDPSSVEEIARRLHAADIQRLEHLAEVQAVLAGGGSPLEARKRTGLDRHVVANHFDEEGRLLISQAVERTLMTRAAPEQVQRLAALPRALRPDELGRLQQVLQDNPGATDAQLRAAARAADVSKAALNYLFIAGTPLRDRLLTLPEAQHGALVAAHAPPAAAEAPPQARGQARARTEPPAQAPTEPRADARTEARTQARARARARTEARAEARAQAQVQAQTRPQPQTQTQAPTRPTVLDPVHRRHLEETRRFEQVANAHLSIMQGHGFRTAAMASGLPEEIVAGAFSAQGHLLLNAVGEGLAQTPDEATARRFAGLPRALDESDMARLAELLHVLPRVSDALLRESAARVGVSPQALAHLFDAGLPMRERIATLPELQRTALEAAMAGSPPQSIEPAHESPPRPVEPAQDHPAPPATGLSQADREFLERHLFGDSDGSPVASPPRSPGLPELPQTEIASILQALHTPQPSPRAEPPQASSPSLAGASSAAASIRSEEASRSSAPPATGLPPEMLESVNQVLRQETEYAQRFAQAQALLVGGASLGQAAKAIGTSGGTLGNSFSEQGHLLLTKAAERLLQARDPANAQPFAALPRALTRSDLALLGRVLRENLGASDAQLHIAAIGARLSRRALAHLFNTGEPLRTRLATLPTEQQRSLGIPVVPQERPRAVSPVRAAPVPVASPPRSPARPPSPVAVTPQQQAPWQLPTEGFGLDEIDAMLAEFDTSPPRSPARPASPVAATPQQPAPWELPTEGFRPDEIDAILAQLDTSPPRSPVTAAQPGGQPAGASPRQPVSPRSSEGTGGPAVGSGSPPELRWGGHGPRTRPAGGLPDPGTPPWSNLDEPTSPTGEALFDTAGSLADPHSRPGSPARHGTPPQDPRRGTTPPPADDSALASQASWAATRQRTTQTRPRQFDLGQPSSSAAPKRPGEQLQAPAAQRPRHGDPAASTTQGPTDLQNLRWGGQGPRTRPAPRVPTPGTDSSSG